MKKNTWALFVLILVLHCPPALAELACSMREAAYCDIWDWVRLNTRQKEETANNLYKYFIAYHHVNFEEKNSRDILAVCNELEEHNIPEHVPLALAVCNELKLFEDCNFKLKMRHPGLAFDFNVSEQSWRLAGGGTKRAIVNDLQEILLDKGILEKRHEISELVERVEQSEESHPWIVMRLCTELALDCGEGVFLGNVTIAAGP